MCKSLVALIEQRLRETDQPHHMLGLGYYTDNLVPRRQQHYITSELRLLEILEDACSKIYDIKSTAEAYSNINNHYFFNSFGRPNQGT